MSIEPPISTHFVALSNIAFKNFEGIILTEIEKLGLPERQEKAIKSGLKQEIWKLYQRGYASSELDKAVKPIPFAQSSGIGKFENSASTAL
jgi:hypothetical protein